ncbi:hypothetical protein TNCV_3032141 [Trichonephila clavipes]|nr:hypothetical protein TNCV_3032141 [Trichonephila clavipes]
MTQQSEEKTWMFVKRNDVEKHSDWSVELARSGSPRTTYSDNGINFRCASNDLSKLDWDKIARETMDLEIL